MVKDELIDFLKLFGRYIEASGSDKEELLSQLIEQHDDIVQREASKFNRVEAMKQ